MSNSGNDVPSSGRTSKQDTAYWKEIVRQYQEPSLGRASWQIVNTIGSYGVIWYLIYLKPRPRLVDHLVARDSGGAVHGSHLHHFS